MAYVDIGGEKKESTMVIDRTALAKAAYVDGDYGDANAGSQGEFAGLLAIGAYHRSRGDHQRSVCLIPSSAHGTNPASAVMAGMQVVVTKCDEQGNVDVADLKARAEEHKNDLAALMITYPSTHGVFEAAVGDICAAVHEAGAVRRLPVALPRFRVERPVLLARHRFHRDDAVVRRREDQRVVDGERRGLELARPRGLLAVARGNGLLVRIPRPGELQPADVVTIDICERRVLLRAGVAAPRAPVHALGGRRLDLPCGWRGVGLLLGEGAAGQRADRDGSRGAGGRRHEAFEAKAHP